MHPDGVSSGPNVVVGGKATPDYGRSVTEQIKELQLQVEVIKKVIKSPHDIEANKEALADLKPLVNEELFDEY